MRRAYDPSTVDAFGHEWQAFDQTGVGSTELERLFENYFETFPWHALPGGSVGVDVGCGSGRWARLVAPRVGMLACLDPSHEAAAVASRNLAGRTAAPVIVGAAGQLPFRDACLDFGYSLGVLHHTPNPSGALRDCVRALRPGAPFLVYLYYALDGRPGWFRGLWRASDAIRQVVSRAPFRTRKVVTTAIAAGIYWPLARLSRVAERRGARVDSIPLSFYREASFYVMRNDALDRFGTPLERRYSAEDVVSLLRNAGLTDVQLAEGPPYWRAIGVKPAAGTGR